MTKREQYIRKICKQLYDELGYHPDNVNCKCAQASYTLHVRLKHLGIRSKLYTVNDKHCFVTTTINGIEYVLDLTYAQFDRKIQDIIVEPLTAYKERNHYYDVWNNPKLVQGLRPIDRKDKVRRTNSSKYFCQYLMRNWPPEQKPKY